MRNYLYSHDLRHIDLIQYLGLYSVDIDGTPINHLSSYKFNAWMEFKMITRGFDNSLLTNYHSKRLIKAAGDDPAFLVYYAPGLMPTQELRDIYSKLESVFETKLTSYDTWNWLVIPLNKTAALTIGNKKAKNFTMREFYVWLCKLYQIDVNERTKNLSDNYYCPEFKKFIQEVEMQIYT